MEVNNTSNKTMLQNRFDYSFYVTVSQLKEK